MTPKGKAPAWRSRKATTAKSRLALIRKCYRDYERRRYGHTGRPHYAVGETATALRLLSVLEDYLHEERRGQRGLPGVCLEAVDEAS